MSNASEREYHDWEPGEATHPMHADPMCRICGNAKDYYLHKDQEEAGIAASEIVKDDEFRDAGGTLVYTVVRTTAMKIDGKAAVGALVRYAVDGGTSMRYWHADDKVALVRPGPEPEPARAVPCAWFALCPNDADGYLPHPILGHTPACRRCASRVGALDDLIPLGMVS